MNTNSIGVELLLDSILKLEELVETKIDTITDIVTTEDNLKRMRDYDDVVYIGAQPLFGVRVYSFSNEESAREYAIILKSNMEASGRRGKIAVII